MSSASVPDAVPLEDSDLSVIKEMEECAKEVNKLLGIDLVTNAVKIATYTNNLIYKCYVHNLDAINDMTDSIKVDALGDCKSIYIKHKQGRVLVVLHSLESIKIDRTLMHDSQAFVAGTAFAKLKLYAETHPSPYRLVVTPGNTMPNAPAMPGLTRQITHCQQQSAHIPHIEQPASLSGTIFSESNPCNEVASDTSCPAGTCPHCGAGKS